MQKGNKVYQISMAFLYAFVLFQAALSLASADNVLTIEQACSYASPHTDLCYKALSTYPESKSADKHQLAGLSIRYAADQGAETAKYIASRKGESGSKEPGMVQCLNDCSEHFIDAVEQLDTSTAALEHKAYEDLDTWISAAKMDGESCNDVCGAYVDKDVEVKEVKKMTDEFLNLCDVAMGLGKLVTSQ